jgi:PPIC-type PPIASE domain
VKQKKLTWSRLIVMICITAVIIGSIYMLVKPDSDDLNEQIVLTIDDYEVTYSEFIPFLQNRKALTANYFKEKYNVEYNKDFWTSDYHGENPLEQAKQNAVDDLLKIKIEQMVMKENGVIQDISYESFLNSLDNENDQRKEKLKNNQPIYGPTQYGAFEFYSYSQSINYQKLIHKMAEDARNTKPDAFFLQLYDDIKQSYFDNGYIFSYEKISVPNKINAQDALEQIKHKALTENLTAEKAASQLDQTVKVEQQQLDLQKVSKDDSLANLLYEAFLEMKDGEFSDIYEMGDDAVVFRIISRDSRGYEDYKDVKDVVAQIYAQNQIEEQVSKRQQDAKVNIIHPVFDKITFS